MIRISHFKFFALHKIYGWICDFPSRWSYIEQCSRFVLVLFKQRISQCKPQQKENATGNTTGSKCDGNSRVCFGL